MLRFMVYKRTIGDGHHCDGSPDEVATVGREFEQDVVPALHSILQACSSCQAGLSCAEVAQRTRLRSCDLRVHMVAKPC